MNRKYLAYPENCQGQIHCEVGTKSHGILFPPVGKIAELPDVT